MKSDKKWDNQSRFEDDPHIYENDCVSVQHLPPTHIFIPQGKIYRHICPDCGHEVILRPTQISHDVDSCKIVY